MGVVAMLEDVEGVFVVALPQNNCYDMGFQVRQALQDQSTPS